MARLQAWNRDMTGTTSATVGMTVDLDAIEAKAEACTQWDANTYRAFYELLQPDVALALVAHIRRLEAERDAMREALKAHEAWEADIIMNADWNTSDGLPKLTQENMNGLNKVQDLRRTALNVGTAGKAKPTA